MRNYVVNRITEWFVKIWITRTKMKLSTLRGHFFSVKVRFELNLIDVSAQDIVFQ